MVLKPFIEDANSLSKVPVNDNIRECDSTLYVGFSVQLRPGLKNLAQRPVQGL